MTPQHIVFGVLIGFGVLLILLAAVILGGVLGVWLPAFFADEATALEWTKHAERPVCIPHWRCMDCGMMIHADYAKLGEPVVCGMSKRGLPPTGPCPMQYIDEHGKVFDLIIGNSADYSRRS